MATNLSTLAQRMGRNLRRIVTVVLLGGWTAGWGMVALVGWAAYSPTIMNAGLTMIAAGLLGYGGAYVIGRRRLKALAEHSLSARAELNALSLSGGMAARLHLFDDAWIQLQTALSDPSLPHADRSAEVTAELSEAQTQLFKMVERHSALEQEINGLDRYAPSELIETTREQKRAERERLERDAEALVRETRTLATTADEVRALASVRSEATTERLKDAVKQFNLTLAAYREVEDELAGQATGLAAETRKRNPQRQSV